MSIGGSCTITIRDISVLPANEPEFRAFVFDLIGPEIFMKLNGMRQLQSEAANAITRELPNIQVTDRGVSIHCKIDF
ncbi:MAG: hypothetical protein JKY94_06885 [Rhodobacteraceae bacterium]|nr:hypothetical protein [Paracoccaceae bacterium]